MTHWYALKSRDELFTADMLREAGYAAYVPCETVERKVNRKKIPVRKPACRGYVFVNCPPEALKVVRSIGINSDFVRNLDPVTGDLVPMRLAPNALVPILLAEIFGDLDYTREPAPWVPARGDAIRVIGGLWRGYLGSIVSVGKRKLVVSFQGVRKEFAAGDLELAA